MDHKAINPKAMDSKEEGSLLHGLKCHSVQAWCKPYNSKTNVGDVVNVYDILALCVEVSVRSDLLYICETANTHESDWNDHSSCGINVYWFPMQAKKSNWHHS